MKKKVLIINGHPNKESYVTALANAYHEGALNNQNVEVQKITLIDLEFNPILYGYGVKQPLEPDLQKAQELILWADHLVFLYPNWWGTMPALLKGFIDRVFLPNFAFKYNGGSFHEKLLKNRTAQVIVTMDTPNWYYNLFYKQPGHRAMKKSILQFCGVDKVDITSIAPLQKFSTEDRAKWINKVKIIGNQFQ